MTARRHLTNLDMAGGSILNAEGLEGGGGLPAMSVVNRWLRTALGPDVYEVAPTGAVDGAAKLDEWTNQTTAGWSTFGDDPYPLPSTINLEHGDFASATYALPVTTYEGPPLLASVKITFTAPTNINLVAMLVRDGEVVDGMMFGKWGTEEPAELVLPGNLLDISDGLTELQVQASRQGGDWETEFLAITIHDIELVVRDGVVVAEWAEQGVGAVLNDVHITLYDEHDEIDFEEGWPLGGSMRILVLGRSNSSEDGIYSVVSETWTPTGETPTAVVPWMTLRVPEGGHLDTLVFLHTSDMAATHGRLAFFASEGGVWTPVALPPSATVPTGSDAAAVGELHMRGNYASDDLVGTRPPDWQHLDALIHDPHEAVDFTEPFLPGLHMVVDRPWNGDNGIYRAYEDAPWKRLATLEQAARWTHFIYQWQIPEGWDGSGETVQLLRQDALVRGDGIQSFWLPTVNPYDQPTGAVWSDEGWVPMGSGTLPDASDVGRMLSIAQDHATTIVESTGGTNGAPYTEAAESWTVNGWAFFGDSPASFPSTVELNWMSGEADTAGATFTNPIGGAAGVSVDQVKVKLSSGGRPSLRAYVRVVDTFANETLGTGVWPGWPYENAEIVVDFAPVDLSSNPERIKVEVVARNEASSGGGPTVTLEAVEFRRQYTSDRYPSWVPPRRAVTVSALYQDEVPLIDEEWANQSGYTFLLTNQSNSAENGFYRLNDSGDGVDRLDWEHKGVVVIAERWQGGLTDEWNWGQWLTITPDWDGVGNIYPLDGLTLLYPDYEPVGRVLATGPSQNITNPPATGGTDGASGLAAELELDPTDWSDLGNDPFPMGGEITIPAEGAAAATYTFDGGATFDRVVQGVNNVYFSGSSGDLTAHVGLFSHDGELLAVESTGQGNGLSFAVEDVEVGNWGEQPYLEVIVVNADTEDPQTAQMSSAYLIARSRKNIAAWTEPPLGVPEPPETGTHTLKAVDGELVWVEDV